ncbi:MAG: YhcH/YjgK/YiaL family protein [Lentisphaerae bacterium]|nr:YhcH/YjgK/YiaL family protein [Lentisphaerota bacterium]
MILDHLNQAPRFETVHPQFAAAFEFLRRPDLAALAPGRHAVDGDRVFALVQKGPGRARAQAPLESHRAYIDIQYVVAGDEEMGWRPTPGCLAPRQDHDQQKDIRFYDDAPASWFVVPPGSFVVFFPEDAHSPSVGAGIIHKIVMKVRVA